MSIHKLTNESTTLSHITNCDLYNFIDEMADKLYRIHKGRRDYYDCERVAYDSLDRILKKLGFAGHVILKRRWH